MSVLVYRSSSAVGAATLQEGSSTLMLCLRDLNCHHVLLADRASVGHALHDAHQQHTACLARRKGLPKRTKTLSAHHRILPAPLNSAASGLTPAFLRLFVADLEIWPSMQEFPPTSGQIGSTSLFEGSTCDWLFWNPQLAREKLGCSVQRVKIMPLLSLMAAQLLAPGVCSVLARRLFGECWPAGWCC